MYRLVPPLRTIASAAVSEGAEHGVFTHATRVRGAARSDQLTCQTSATLNFT